MYACAEVARYISSDEYRTAGIFKRLGSRLHLAMCKHCSRYLRQLQALAIAARSVGSAVTPAEIEAARNRILQELSSKD